MPPTLALEKLSVIKNDSNHIVIKEKTTVVRLIHTIIRIQQCC